MNARQKAKKYKRELEMLRDIHNRWMRKFAFEDGTREIVTIRVAERYRMMEIAHIPPKVVANSMIRLLMDADEIRQAITLDNHYEEITDTMLVRAELKVVMPDA